MIAVVVSGIHHHRVADLCKSHTLNDFPLMYTTNLFLLNWFLYNANIKQCFTIVIHMIANTCNKSVNLEPI